jgi:hydroxymethylglutaryl-CoA lyase
MQAEVVKHALTLPGLTVMALVPNLKGAEAALAAGVHKLTIPVSASEAHSLANVRKTREDMVEEVRNIIALKNERAPRVKVEAGVSTAFGCTIQGVVAEENVLRFSCGIGQRRSR